MDAVRSSNWRARECLVTGQILVDLVAKGLISEMAPERIATASTSTTWRRGAHARKAPPMRESLARGASGSTP
jgi:hypothetical protein